MTRPKKSERVVAPEDLTFVEFLKLIHGSTHILRKWLKEAADKKLTALELLNELDDEVLLDKVETKLASTNPPFGTFTPENAPRTLFELQKIGIFQTRILIGKLGGLETPEQKQAFNSMMPDKKSQTLLKLLEKWDEEQRSLRS